METQDVLKIVIAPLNSEGRPGRMVCVRISWDNWISFSDIKAMQHHHQDSDIDSRSNRFIANVAIPCGEPSDKSVIQFAVKHVTTDGIEHWDNNNHQNYQLKWVSEPEETTQS